MKKINAKVAMPVNVIVNTMDKSRDRWAQIQNGTPRAKFYTPDSRRIFDGSQKRVITLARKSDSV